jgi:hypothetical protein
MLEETCGRGQVEWVLWCSFVRARFNPGQSPRVFRTRVKRLLDIDRHLDLTGAEVPPEASYAFAAPPAIEGAEAEYLAVDAFCLAIALDLLDAGFKQSEVVGITLSSGVGVLARHGRLSDVHVRKSCNASNDPGFSALSEITIIVVR